MRVLFATYLSIQGLNTNVELVNGKNTAVIAMGDPFRPLFTASEDPNQEIIELIYNENVVKGHLPDLDGIILTVEDHGLSEAISLAHYFHNQKPQSEIHFVIKYDIDFTDLSEKPFLHETVYRHRHNGDGDSRRIMQLLLQRFLAIGTLKARF